MNTSSIRNVIIIGSGPAGLTAGIYAARANLNPLIIEGKTPGGQLIGTSAVENWPGEKSILGPVLMSNMRAHAEHLGCEFLAEEVVSADLANRPFTLTTHRGRQLQTNSIIIATGATPKKLNVPGEADYWGKGVTTCAVCDGAFYKDREVIIVGGGDTAMEDASFMTKFTNKITLIHILDKLTACHAMQERVINEPKIKILYESTLTAINGNGSHVTGATITHQKTKQSTNVSVDGIFIAIGLTPNTAPFKGQLTLNPYGYIVATDETKTSVPGVFVAGDVSDDKYRQAITSAGAGCKAALDVERYLHSL
jgi:thioredoxin reductase (NADPH)